MTMIPFEQPGLHPDRIANVGDDFGGTYPDFATFQASLAGRGFGSDAGSSDAHFDDTGDLKFNGHASLVVTNGASYGANFNYPGELRAVWLRCFVYLDPTLVDHDPMPGPGFNFVSLPQLEGHRANALPYFYPAGENAEDNAADTWDIDASQFPVFNNFDVDTPYDDIKGRFIPVIFFAELLPPEDPDADPTPQRVRMWDDVGALVLDITNAGTGRERFGPYFDTLGFKLHLSHDVADYVIAMGQYEWVDADVNPTPYCGLEGFPDCCGTTYTARFT